MRISIVGSGWLSRPLAQALSQEASVQISTTTERRRDELRAQGFSAEQVILTAQSVTAPVSFLACDVMILAIPPRGQGGPIQTVMQTLKTQLGDPYVLFISSTSVFSDDQGLVTESTRPTSPGAADLIAAEQVLFGPKTTILRLGGLVGPERHPGRFLAGRTRVPRGPAPINLIHQADAIGLIQAILQHKSWGEHFHGVCDDHRTRQEFYSQAASALGLEPPVFEPCAEPTPKLVLNRKVKRVLHYTFRYPLLDLFCHSRSGTI